MNAVRYSEAEHGTMFCNELQDMLTAATGTLLAAARKFLPISADTYCSSRVE